MSEEDPFSSFREDYGLDEEPSPQQQPTPQPTPSPSSTPAPQTPAPASNDPFSQFRERYIPVVETVSNERAEVQQSTEREVQGVIQDIATLDTGRVQEVEDWGRLARTVLRLSNIEGDDEESQQARNLAFSIVDQHSNINTFEDALNVEGATEEWWTDQYQRQSGDGDDINLLSSRTGEYEGPGLEAPIGQLLSVLDKPSQGVLTALALATEDDTNRHMEMLDALSRGFTFRGQSEESAEILGDEAVDGINFREAVGLDDWEGPGFNIGDRRIDVGGAVDLAGTIATDPLTFITAGASPAARSALTSVGRRASEELGEATAVRMIQTIQRNGFRALAKEERDQVTRWITEDAIVEASSRAARTGDVGVITRARQFITRADDSIEAIAQRQAENLQNARSGVRVGGQTVLPTGAVPDLLESAGLKSRKIFDVTDEGFETMRIQSGLFSSGLDNSMVSGIREAIVPRASIIDDAAFGGRQANEIGDLQASVRAKFEAQIDDMSAQLRRGGVFSRSLIGKAAREVDGYDNLNTLLNRALSDADEFTRAIGATDGAVRELLETVAAVRQEGLRAAIRAGADPQVLEELSSTYIPRISNPRATRKIQDALDADPTLDLGDLAPRAPGSPDDRIQSVLGQEGHLQGRTFRPEINDLTRVNEEAATYLNSMGVEDVGDLFLDDVLQATALRTRSAFEAEMVMDLFKGVGTQRGLMDMVDTAGRNLAFVADTANDRLSTALAMKNAGADVADYARVKLPNGGEVFVQRTIYEEMEQVRRVLRNNDDLGSFRNVMNKWNGLWGAYATLPLAGVGFHARNGVGNAFNAFLGGVRNPARYVEAMDLQRKYASVRRLMRREGSSFDEALESVVGKTEAADFIREARAQGVFNSGQIDDIFDESSLGARGLDRINPVSQNNALLQSGRMVGSAIENNARLALFINNRRLGINAVDSASEVRKYLFDYGDLTRFESDNIRMMSRFYTFLRKNTALQAGMLAQFPGRVNNAQRIAEEFTNTIAGDPEGTDGLFIPDWAAPAGMQVRGGDLVGIETPLQAAAEAADSAMAITSLVPGVEIGAYGDRQNRIAQGLGLFSGAPVAAIEYIYGERFGSDPFTGAPLSNDGLDSWLRFTEILAPVADKIVREGEDVGLWGDDSDPWEINVMNAILGLQTYDLDDDQQSRALSGAAWNLQEALAEAGQNGVDVPTLDELREAGIIDQQNRALAALFYGDVNDPEVMEQLESLVGSDVMTALEMARTTPLAVGGDMTEQELIHRVTEMRDALQIMRSAQGLPPLTEDEMSRALLASPWAPTNSDLREAGIEPVSYSNRFIERDASEEELVSESMARLNLIGSVLGLDAQTIMAVRPLLTDAQSALREAADAGLSEEEAVERLIEDLSRAEQGTIFGVESLEAFRDGSVDADELRRVQNRAWERESELQIIMEVEFGRQPTPQEIQQYVWGIELTRAEEELLGVEGEPSIPNRRDVRTDEEVLRDALLQNDAIERGIVEGPVLGDN